MIADGRALSPPVEVLDPLGHRHVLLGSPRERRRRPAASAAPPPAPRPRRSAAWPFAGVLRRFRPPRVPRLVRFFGGSPSDTRGLGVGRSHPAGSPSVSPPRRPRPLGPRPRLLGEVRGRDVDPRRPARAVRSSAARLPRPRRRAAASLAAAPDLRVPRWSSSSAPRVSPGATLPRSPRRRSRRPRSLSSASGSAPVSSSAGSSTSAFFCRLLGGVAGFSGLGLLRARDAGRLLGLGLERDRGRRDRRRRRASRTRRRRARARRSPRPSCRRASRRPRRRRSSRRPCRRRRPRRTGRPRRA